MVKQRRDGEEAEAQRDGGKQRKGARESEAQGRKLSTKLTKGTKGSFRLRRETTKTWDWIAKGLAMGVSGYAANCARGKALKQETNAEMWDCPHFVIHVIQCYRTLTASRQVV